MPVRQNVTELQISQISVTVQYGKILLMDVDILAYHLLPDHHQYCLGRLAWFGVTHSACTSPAVGMPPGRSQREHLVLPLRSDQHLCLACRSVVAQRHLPSRRRVHQHYLDCPVMNKSETWSIYKALDKTTFSSRKYRAHLWSNYPDEYIWDEGTKLWEIQCLTADSHFIQ